MADELVMAHIPGLRNLKGRFARMAERGLVEAQLVTALELGDAALILYQEAAPHDKGDFARSFEHHIEETPFGFSLAVTTKNPKLRQWLSEGTGIYGPTGSRIYPTSAKMLVFDWPSGPDSLRGADGLFHFTSIAGMKPNDWEEHAKIMALPLLIEQGNKIGTRVTATLAHGRL